MGCIGGIFGAILPRFALLVGWYNDTAYWDSLFGSQIWLFAGFIFLPWTTLIYGFLAPNGMSAINWVFLGAAVLADLGTWGIGFFGGRKDVDAYRGS